MASNPEKPKKKKGEFWRHAGELTAIVLLGALAIDLAFDGV